MKSKDLLFIALLIGIISCAKQNKQDEWDEKNFKTLEAGDPRVEAAKKAAQDSLVFYVEYFKKYYSTENYAFYLKKPYHEDDYTEHMWATPFAIKSDFFVCVLNNVPRWLTNVSLGDTVMVKFDEIEDFSIVTADSTLIGNYFEKEFDYK